MKIGDVVQAAYPTANFRDPARIRYIRYTSHGTEYGVINGLPNNESLRWYTAKQIRIVQEVNHASL